MKSILTVTLHVRVWIEIVLMGDHGIASTVTLHVRVWIEIYRQRSRKRLILGHPPREGVD